MLGSLFALFIKIFKSIEYKDSPYHRFTKNSYVSIQNKGRELEYLTYLSLRYFENSGAKFLFNIDVPKRSGGTTEIDVLLICAKGIFVFECKNFSGWIFGNETQRYWTQTLPLGRGRCQKDQFYNPILQNAGHIKHLKILLGKNVPMKSIIVFSDRCEFKNITRVTNVNLVHNYRVSQVVTKICNQTPDIYTDLEIKIIYNKLAPYTYPKSPLLEM